MKVRVEVKEIVSKDIYGRLAVFLSSFENDPDTEDRWLLRMNSWWDENPEFHEGMLRGWVLEDAGSLVGFLGVFPSRMVVAGTEMIVQNQTTWRIGKEYRNLSLHLQARSIKHAAGTLLFNTTGPATIPILKQLKFELLPGKDDSEIEPVYGFIINIDKFLKKKYVNLKRQRVFLLLLRLLVRVYARLRISLISAKGYRVELVRSIEGQPFDRFWEETRNDFDTTAVRDSKTLNWICFGNPELPKSVLACYHGERLEGYAVFTGRKGRFLDMLVILDLRIKANHPDALPAILKNLNKLALASGKDGVESRLSGPRYRHFLKRTGFVKITEETRCDYVRIGDNVMLDRIRNGSSYYSEMIGDRYQ